jgi:hypothetical protein
MFATSCVEVSHHSPASSVSAAASGTVGGVIGHAPHADASNLDPRKPLGDRDNDRPPASGDVGRGEETQQRRAALDELTRLGQALGL